MSDEQGKKLMKELVAAQDDDKKLTAALNKVQILWTTRVVQLNQVFPDTRAVKAVHDRELENAKRFLTFFTKLNLAVGSGDEKEIGRLNKELPEFMDDWLKIDREVTESLNELMRKNGLNR